MRILPLATAALILLGSAGALTGCGGEASAENGDGTAPTAADALRPRPVTVVEPQRRDFTRVITTTGSLQPIREATIRALQEGTITRLAVDIGDRVDQGDLLFETRPDNARLAVRRSEAALATALAGLEDLKAWRRPEEVARLRALLSQQEAEADRLEAEKRRARQLFEDSTISESEWDQARTAADAARAQLAVVREDLAIAEAGPTREALAIAEARVSEAEAALATARQQLDDSSVFAPFAGYVTARHEREGGYASRGDHVVDLADVGRLEAEMYIPERFSTAVEKGQTVSLRLQSNGIRAEGVITHVNRSVDRRTRNFLVKVTVDNPGGAIKGGAFAVGEIHLPTDTNALSLPREAVMRDEGRAFVYIANGGTASRRYIRVGEEQDGRVQIREGLDESSLVILQGRGAISDGDDVEIGREEGSA